MDSLFLIRLMRMLVLEQAITTVIPLEVAMATYLQGEGCSLWEAYDQTAQLIGQQEPYLQDLFASVKEETEGGTIAKDLLWLLRISREASITTVARLEEQVKTKTDLPWSRQDKLSTALQTHGSYLQLYMDARRLVETGGKTT